MGKKKKSQTSRETDFENLTFKFRAGAGESAA